MSIPGYSGSTSYTPDQLRRWAKQAALSRGIDPGTFVRQMGVESVGFDPAVASGQRNSPAGAEGVAQIMPATAKDWGVDPLNPRAALLAAATHMKQYINQYGGWRNALVAYNAGPGRVGGTLPSETQNYIQKILGGGAGPAISHAPAGDVAPFSPVTASGPSPVKYKSQGDPIQWLSNTFKAMDQSQQQEQANLGNIFSSTGSYLPTEADYQKNYTLIEQLGQHGIKAHPATGMPNDSPITVPGTGPDTIRTLIERANAISKHHYNYEWGGGHSATGVPGHGVGHGSGPGVGFDCSGAVSAVFGINPQVASQFMGWGAAGPGKHVTVYAKSTHVLMEINGHFFGTSLSNPGGGAGWIPAGAINKSYLQGFVARHPNGM